MIHKECTHKFSLRSAGNTVLACVYQTSKFFFLSGYFFFFFVVNFVIHWNETAK